MLGTSCKSIAAVHRNICVYYMRISFSLATIYITCVDIFKMNEIWINSQIIFVCKQGVQYSNLDQTSEQGILVASSLLTIFHVGPHHKKVEHLCYSYKKVTFRNCRHPFLLFIN